MHDNHHCEFAERSVLGAILFDGLVAMDQCMRLRPEHFSLASHREIFAACQKHFATNSEIDDLAIRKLLGDRLQAVGGVAYLSSLTTGIFSGFDLAQRVESVLEAWKLRRGYTLCNSFAARFEAGEPSADVLSTLSAQVLDAIQDGAEQDDPHIASYSGSVMADLMARATDPEQTGLSYGLAPLDILTGGMKPGEVTVVGARSGVGKTSLLKQSAVANAQAGVPVVIFSLEASRAEMLEGIWSIVSGVEFRKVARPQLLDIAERERLQYAAQVVSEWPLRIYDSGELTLNQIVALARMNVRVHGARLVMLDYAQSVVEPEGKDERMRVMAVSRKLTRMAKQEKCALMLLSQLRKMPHEQYSKLPTAADLRETAQLENDAHAIVLLHRGWDEEKCQISDDATVIVPKLRRGRTGVCSARFNGWDLRFEATGALSTIR